MSTAKLEHDVMHLSRDVVGWFKVLAIALFISTIMRHILPGNADALDAADTILIAAAVWVGIRAHVAAQSDRGEPRA